MITIYELRNLPCTSEINKNREKSTNLSENVIGAKRTLLDFPVSGNGRTVSEFVIRDLLTISIIISGCMIRFAILILIAALSIQGVVGARIPHRIGSSTRGVEEAAGGGGAGPAPERGAFEI